MKKVVLYARVSSDAQQKEATIDSQLFELKKQIGAAGDVLVKEYIDDGYTGTLLDRPALEQMRADLKTDLFEAIYFHSADRIACDVAHQIIIVGELLKYGKQIVIDGKDYKQNPENKLTLTMLGAFAEFERAKIIERTMRGRLHRLRMGELSSTGHRIYGYDYVKKTSDARASLVINEEQAAVVRSIFEMFASGDYGLVTITRFLEDRRIPTRTGRPQWDRGQIKFMLKNETYAGTRYYNRITGATEAARQGKQVIRGKWVLRDRTEWIAVEVPAIVPRELFEKVQQRLRQHEERYCQPVTRYLLSGLVQCAVCGSGCSSSRRYHKVRRPSGRVSVYHRSVYRCNRRARQYAHDLTQRCRNSEIGTHILEGKVFEMIRETMLDPGKLRGCLDGGGTDDRSTARDFARIARMISDCFANALARYGVIIVWIGSDSFNIAISRSVLFGSSIIDAPSSERRVRRGRNFRLPILRHGRITRPLPYPINSSPRPPARLSVIGSSSGAVAPRLYDATIVKHLGGGGTQSPAMDQRFPARNARYGSKRVNLRTSICCPGCPG